MENDPLKHIFSNFDPELTPGDHFTQRVADSLKAVEAVKSEMALQRRRNRKAVVIGALAGFVAGCLCMLLLPYLKVAVVSWMCEQASSALPERFINCFMIVAWCLTGLTSAIISLNAYELAKSLLRPTPAKYPA